jgi:hypothetical protein
MAASATMMMAVADFIRLLPRMAKAIRSMDQDKHNMRRLHEERFIGRRSAPFSGS